VNAFADVDGLLRGRAEAAAEIGPAVWRNRMAVGLIGGILYGAVMGSYGGVGLQGLYSGLKVPLLVGVSTLLCLPNFYTVNAVLGLRSDFGRALRAILAAQVTVAAVLACLAPLTAFFYLGIAEYGTAVALNGVMFLVAALAGQVTLARAYRPLVAENPLHRVGRAAWLTLYVFVAIQAAWVVRPFVGDPALPTRFLRAGAWGNAYVEIVGLLLRIAQSL